MCARDVTCRSEQRVESRVESRRDGWRAKERAQRGTPLCFRELTSRRDDRVFHFQRQRLCKTPSAKFGIPGPSTMAQGNASQIFPVFPHTGIRRPVQVSLRVLKPESVLELPGHGGRCERVLFARHDSLRLSTLGSALQVTSLAHLPSAGLWSVHCFTWKGRRQGCGEAQGH